MRKTLEQRQKAFDKAYAVQRSDGGLDKLTKYFHDLWPEARIDMVTLFVTGQHQLPPKELPSKKKVPQVELWLGIYIHSAEPIPNLPRGLSKEGLAGTFVFVHPADSVRTHSHSTLVSALYSGNDPPTIPP
ncbi:MAG: hypothetical protein ACLQDQ_06590 [Myxococcaceae bacterium]